MVDNDCALLHTQPVQGWQVRAIVSETDPNRRLFKNLDYLDDEVTFGKYYAEVALWRLDCLTHTTFWQRLRWLLTGREPKPNLRAMAAYPQRDLHDWRRP